MILCLNMHDTKCIDCIGFRMWFSFCISSCSVTNSKERKNSNNEIRRSREFCLVELIKERKKKKIKENILRRYDFQWLVNYMLRFQSNLIERMFVVMVAEIHELWLIRRTALDIHNSLFVHIPASGFLYPEIILTQSHFRYCLFSLDICSFFSINFMVGFCIRPNCDFDIMARSAVVIIYRFSKLQFEIHTL